MNKRGLIKYIFILISAFISLYFMNTSNIGFSGSFLNLPMLFTFLIALTIFMFYKKNKIKKNKFVYDVILLLLMIFSAICFALFLYSQVTCYIDINCNIDLGPIFTITYPIILFIILLFNFEDMFKQTKKANDILMTIVSILVILIHLRYYLDSNFIYRGNDEYLVSYQYITQNYIYFIIMYVIIMLHRRINE